MTFSRILITLFSVFAISNAYSQFIIDAELRPRFEYRHGYKTLFPDNADAASFVSQRTRLNFSYKTEKLHFYLSPQDVRVWGDVPQLNVADNNGISLHQAWAEFLLIPHVNLKLGRQEIVYDDHRIFGNVGWAQQGRSHDAAIAKFNSENLKLHLGAAYNQDGEALTGNTLYTKTYKNLHYVWLQQKWQQHAVSFLFLNNGLQFIDELDETNNKTRYSQTTGVHLVTQFKNFKLASNLYYQFGKDVANNDLSAYLLSIDANYKATTNLNLGLGGEIQSGNDFGAPLNGKNNAFTPLYGTNHKFNGFMDYFYVGNHLNNVGLVNFYGKTKYNINKKVNLNLALHQFYAAAEIEGETSKNLGFETDFVTSVKLNQFVNLQAGYSQFFASAGIEAVKNNFDKNTNNWGWLMITIDPVLFTWEQPKL
ncbi:MAG: hypothetical protein CL526_07090 [Aequorivita sp.]|nr:hypothetical protein [Aequorivita sp.]|tara:strand:+ start:88691 stop:89959 length:1269 start_codon:yes stop_codon:yes gene_type:complete